MQVLPRLSSNIFFQTTFIECGCSVDQFDLVFCWLSKFNILSTVHFYNVLFDGLNTTANYKEELVGFLGVVSFLGFLNFHYQFHLFHFSIL